ncbi:MAG: oxidoreductase, short-chain dehydrogenase/reductase family [Mycobacterium sp.]|nr:oxidoreductase, short-chain dehydrogenase/reductase family [Mycobacterium sp.]
MSIPESVERVAVVTGASSGIGAATARVLAAQGYQVVIGARRMERLNEVAATCGPNVTAKPLDVTDPASVQAFAQGIERCDVLVNNAGGALGMVPIEQADEEQWRWMFDANVLGTLRVTKALLPAIKAATGQIVVLGSVAGTEVYDGGAGYTAAKHAEHAFAETLRLELLGTGVRVAEIAPGLVETEFSLVRLGSQEAADKVYEGLTPLTADDVADVIGYVVSRPAHVSLGYIRLTPAAQASATRTYRSS